jgi:diguanylate cyclase (GGDEF)-like protein
MDEKAVRVLAVEDNEEYGLLMRMMLEKATFPKFDVQCVTRLSEALVLLEKTQFSIVLLDLNLPDSKGFTTFTALQAHAPRVPIVVLTVLDDESVAIEAVRKGAQDYLLKTHVDGDLLSRCIRYAIERKVLTDDLRDKTVRDELTGLYNRRGLNSFASQEMKIAKRLKMRLHLLFADVDGFKNINDTLGHTVGDEALVDVANILKDTFRESDVIARIGGDEFVVLALETSPAGAETIGMRLRRAIDDFVAEHSRPYEISVSMGIAHFDPDSPAELDELVQQADRMMYRHKQNKQNG